MIQSDHAKRENASPDAKLLLRRYFLDTYHADATPARPAYVFDACQADGELWSTLRREYPVRYWGVDVKKKRGRLAVDSVRILHQPRLPFDVVDIDTYGSPWRHWLALLPNVRKPVTVFLTFRGVGGVIELGDQAIAWLGLSPIMRHIPSVLRWRLSEYAAGSLLSAPLAFGHRVVDVQEATASRNARYIGVRIVPDDDAHAPAITSPVASSSSDS